MMKLSFFFVLSVAFTITICLLLLMKYSFWPSEINTTISLSSLFKTFYTDKKYMSDVRESFQTPDLSLYVLKSSIKPCPECPVCQKCEKCLTPEELFKYGRSKYVLKSSVAPHRPCPVPQPCPVCECNNRENQSGPSKIQQNNSNEQNYNFDTAENETENRVERLENGDHLTKENPPVDELSNLITSGNDSVLSSSETHLEEATALTNSQRDRYQKDALDGSLGVYQCNGPFR